MGVGMSDCERSVLIVEDEAVVALDMAMTFSEAVRLRCSRGNGSHEAVDVTRSHSATP